MRKRRTIGDAAGKHRVEIQQRRDGFETEQWEVVKQRWRRVESPLDGRIFESYAAAVYALGLRNSWLGKALMDELGTGSGYHLELLRGMTYSFAAYPCGDRGMHDHCDNCWATFMFNDRPDMQHEGYVAKYFIPGGNGAWQWSWICHDCFATFRKRLQWQVTSPPAG